MTEKVPGDAGDAGWATGKASRNTPAVVSLVAGILGVLVSAVQRFFPDQVMSLSPTGLGSTEGFESVGYYIVIGIALFTVPNLVLGLTAVLSGLVGLRRRRRIRALAAVGTGLGILILVRLVLWVSSLEFPG